MKRVPVFRSMLPDNVIATDRRTSEPQIVLDEEVRLTETMRTIRKAEFLTGRTCARLVLRALGYEDSPLLIAKDRSPIWPHGTVGSISHTGDYCIAAVGLKEHFEGIGVDVEVGGAARMDIKDLVTSESELERMPQNINDKLTKLFCIKESVFKCTNPFTGVFLDFSDVDVTFLSMGEFRAEILAKESPIRYVTGNWKDTGKFVGAFSSIRA